MSEESYIWSLNQSGPHSCWFELIIILLQPYQDSDAIIKCNILAAWQEYEAYCLICYMSFTEILFQFPLIIIVSDWLLFNTNLAISWQEQVNFQWNDDKVRCDNFYSASLLKQQSMMDMSLHLDTLFWFQANQSLLFLLNASCLAEK